MCKEIIYQGRKPVWAHAETNKGSYNAELLITANDRTGLLVDITLILNELKIPLRALNAKTTTANSA